MTMAGRRAILVLGMHRSGTSAAARTLNLLGAEVSDKLVAPAEDNSLGFWEHSDAVDLNERLLFGLGRSWDDIRPMPEGWLQSDIACQAVQSARELIRANFSHAPLWLLKDPRLCRVLPIWLQALQAEHIEPLCVFVARHPFEVALSLAKRDGTPGSFACFLWLRYMLEAEFSTRGYARVMMTYDDLLLDWRACMRRGLALLGVTYEASEAVAAAVDGYLSRAERHHMYTSSSISVWRHWYLVSTVKVAYKICEELAKLPNSSRKWADLGAMLPRVEKLFSRFQRGLPEILEAMHRSRMRAYGKEGFYKDSIAELIAEVRACNVAFAAAEKLALERLTEAGHMTVRLHEADRALAEAADRESERNKELRALNESLIAIDRALASASHLALGRLAQINELTARIAELEGGLSRATELALERLRQLDAMTLRLSDTDKALASASELGKQKVEELRALDKALADARHAHSHASELAIERLSVIKELEEHNAIIERACVVANQLALERMQENERLRRRMAELEEGLEQAEQLAVTRLGEIERLTRESKSADCRPPVT